MKDIKTYVLETKKILSIDNYILEGFKLGKNKVKRESKDDLYIVYEFSSNELESDSYLSKCLRETYENRSIDAIGSYGLRYYMHILTIKEFKSCFTKWPKSFTSIKYAWIAPEEIQGKKPKDIEKYIKNNTDKIQRKELISGEKIKIDIRE